MQITLEKLGKRYNREWIFRNINCEFNSDKSYAILGSNGSGKSTLLQVIAGNQLPSEGKINYSNDQVNIAAEQIFHQLSFAAPYLELIEEYSLTELIQFQAHFKPFLSDLSATEIVQIIGLEKSKDKELKYYSSGMKQRVRLALALLSNTPIILLDEPTSNLDKKGIEWYSHLVHNYAKNRLLIVCSNHINHEYEFCKEQLLMEDFK